MTTSRFYRYISLIALSTVLGASAISCNLHSDDEYEVKNYVKVGDAVPQFSVSRENGTVFNSEQFKGKRSLLVLFHTSCSDCQAALPVINSVYNSVAENEECMVVAISRGENEESIGNYWKKSDLSIPYYADTSRAIFNLFANFTIPRAYIINKEGVVEWMAIERLGVDAAELTSLLTTGTPNE